MKNEILEMLKAAFEPIEPSDPPILDIIEDVIRSARRHKLELNVVFMPNKGGVKIYNGSIFTEKYLLAEVTTDQWNRRINDVVLEDAIDA